MAPEVLGYTKYEDEEGAESEEYTVGVDTWSLGCVLSQLLTLKVPFEPKELQAYGQSKPGAKFPVRILQKCKVSAACIELIRSL